jgi:RimJ/RimL family protein N-acetyltransferase
MDRIYSQEELAILPGKRIGSQPYPLSNQELLELKVFHPRRKGPTARSNLMLEGYVRKVVSSTNGDDLLMRFFGRPNIEAIPGRITGRISDPYEQPRDAVIVAFVNRRPVGYTDISRFSEPPDTAELSMLVRTGMQRRGIGQAMLQEAVRVLREEGVSHLEAYIHPDNWKMQKAFQKWSRTEELRDVTFRISIGDGEIIYALDVESQQ